MLLFQIHLENEKRIYRHEKQNRFNHNQQCCPPASLKLWAIKIKSLVHSKQRTTHRIFMTAFTVKFYGLNIDFTCFHDKLSNMLKYVEGHTCIGSLLLDQKCFHSEYVIDFI